VAADDTDFRATLHALTRGPAGAALPAGTPRHAPAVGLLVGLFGALVLWSAAHLWPAAVAVGLAMAATAWLTGARHERAWAAACDGAARAEGRLGAAGAVGLLALLGLKAVTLHALALRDFAGVLAALPLAHALSRGAPGLLLAAPGGTAGARAWALGGLLVAAAAAAWVWPALHVALAVAVAAAVAAVAVRGLRPAHDAGTTFGAAQQGAELAVLLALLAARTQG
jgi:adenosylcobinamide-GDP ribazoletransferase